MADTDNDFHHGADISWPLERPDGQQNGQSLSSLLSPTSLDPSFMVGGSRALNGISSRSFYLGVTFGVMSIITVELAYLKMFFWRATCFVAILSMFHYLEFYATARYNPADAKLSSFLLSSNGSAYRIAHTAALIEFGIRNWLLYTQRTSWLEMPSQLPIAFPSYFLPLLAFALVAAGQGVRTAAMAEAGTSFNHLVQSRKKIDHVLVQSGVYRILRHPSYFGFFWWALGTQVLLGNHICFLAYAAVLWKFFAARIAKEEQFLVKFFGQEYVRYRDRTPVLIPFIP